MHMKCKASVGEHDKLRQYFQPPSVPLYPIIQGDTSLIFILRLHYVLYNFQKETSAGNIQVSVQIYFYTISYLLIADILLSCDRMIKPFIIILGTEDQSIAFLKKNLLNKLCIKYFCGIHENFNWLCRNQKEWILSWVTRYLQYTGGNFLYERTNLRLIVNSQRQIRKSELLKMHQKNCSTTIPEAKK